jgi:hypothetical protein
LLAAARRRTRHARLVPAAAALPAGPATAARPTALPALSTASLATLPTATLSSLLATLTAALPSVLAALTAALLTVLTASGPGGPGATRGTRLATGLLALTGLSGSSTGLATGLLPAAGAGRARTGPLTAGRRGAALVASAGFELT